MFFFDYLRSRRYLEPRKRLLNERRLATFRKAKRKVDFIRLTYDPSLALQELQLIRGAMSQIESDTKNCVKFIPYDPVNRTDFLSVTPLEDAG
jgi:hypothetical protein